MSWSRGDVFLNLRVRDVKLRANAQLKDTWQLGDGACLCPAQGARVAQGGGSGPSEDAKAADPPARQD